MSKVILHVDRNIQERMRKQQQTNKQPDKIIANEVLNKEKAKTTNNNSISQVDSKKLQQTKSQQILTSSPSTQQQKGKSIREIQQFFQQRYLGPKKNSKISSFNKLLKTPLFNPQSQSTLYKMITPNLNHKLKQIQKIFNAQRKNTLKKTKKVLVESDNLSQFQLYLTKRDILRQKNQTLEDMRKYWQQEKLKQEEKKLKKKLLKNGKLNQQINKELSQQCNKVIEQQQQKSTYQQTKQQEKTVLITQQKNLSETTQKQRSISFNAQVTNNDQYFQKKFEQKIVKNSFSTQHKFSIRSMLQPSRTRKTTLNSHQFFKNQLDMIQNVAKNTIDNFHHRQKINKILYSQPTQSQESLSKRATPIIRDYQLKEIKSIDWVLKQCQTFKKRFNIRKSKSLSNIKKST